jgi:ribosomal protein S18 acetylase RimI-like enzyme/chorismate mutase
MRSEPSDVVLRPAESDDLPAVAALLLRARSGSPFLPPLVHPPDEVRSWVGGWDLGQQDVWVAESAGALLGFARAHAAWLDDLYVDPAHQRAGVGTLLLDLVRSTRPGGFCLWVFVSNRPARAFYRKHGLVELEQTDGSANEERCPDLRMAWPGTAPVAFFRGLVDEVDADLGDLLARRAALTRAIQPYKHADQRDLQREIDRDLQREREIAQALARRAPALGEDRLSRILHTIITESLDAAADPPPVDP